MLSIAELRACGLNDRAVPVRVRNGRLHQLHRGVYAVGHVNLSLEGRLLAAVKACGPSAVLSHYSAAALWGFIEWDDRFPEVTVLGTSTRYAPRGPRVHRTSLLDRTDIFRHRGIAMTSPAWTLLDLASTLDYRRLRRATRQAQSLSRVSMRQLVDILGRLGARRGSRKLAQIIATGPAPTRSELEDVVLDLILRGGLVHPRGERTAASSAAAARPRLPLARAASGPRGRRRCLARQQARARGRRRAPGAARGPRRARAARHVGPGDRSPRPHARPAASGGRALH